MNHRETERKVNAIIDEVLDEGQEDVDATRSPCPDDCERPQSTPEETPWPCKCGVENSPRFSLRVMEAMRSLQRDVDRPSTSSAEEIVDYIRANYRSDGDLYAQVRTALRQVCSQGFVLELLRNEYHLVGPVVRSKRKNGCSLDCEGRATPTTEDIPRRRDNDRGNGPPRRRLQTSFEEPVDERIYADHGDVEEFVSRHDQRRDEAEPIPGPSRGFVSPIDNAKRARLEDRRVQRADDEETVTEADMDCVVCNAEEEYQVPRGRERPRGRPRGNRRRRRPRENGEEDEENGENNEENDEEDEENGEDDEEERREDDDDEDTDDGVYRELRVRGPRGRARERELRRWIRRCREECERRRRR